MKKLNTHEAAEYLKDIGTPFSAGTLEVWRSQGRGPRFCRLNRKVFYLRRDLDEFTRGEVVETEDSVKSVEDKIAKIERAGDA